MIMNIKIDTPRGQSASFSINNSRVSLAYLNFFSIVYVEHIQALINNSFWADQVEISIFEELALSYITPKVEESNNTSKAKTLEFISEPHDTSATNICNPHNLELFAILYAIN